MTGTSRVTVLGPERRADLVVPADCPVADLLPSVLPLVTADDPGDAERDWRLARLAGGGLDPDQTLADAGVLDGDVLVLDDGRAGPPAPVVDDVPSAVAGTVRALRQPGGAAPALVVAAAAVLWVAAAVTASGWWTGAGTRAGVAAAATALVVVAALAIALSVRTGHVGAAALLGLGGLPGWALLATAVGPDGAAGRLATALTAVGVAAVAGTVVLLRGRVAAWSAVWFATAAATAPAAAVTAGGAVLRARPAPVAVAGTVAGVLLLAALPALVVRAGGLAGPAVAGDPADEVGTRTEDAVRLLAAARAGVLVGLVAAWSVLAGQGGAQLTLAGLTAAVVLVQATTPRFGADGTVRMLGGLAVVVLCALWGLHRLLLANGPAAATLAAVLFVAAALGSAAASSRPSGGRHRPGRTLWLARVETVLYGALVPATVTVLGGYSALGALAHRLAD